MSGRVRAKILWVRESLDATVETGARVRYFEVRGD
jgi:hypothetical protein